MATEQVLPCPETPQTEIIRARSKSADGSESLEVIPLVADDRQASARKKAVSPSASSNTALTSSSSSSSSSPTKAAAFPVDPSSLDRLVVLVAAIAAWYLVGVGAIVTTKILLTDWKVPPLLLTFQQLLAGSTVLRSVLSLRPLGAQPLPWEREEMSNQLLLQHHDNSNGDSEAPLPMKLGAIWEHHSDFLLAGLFNGLDFLASNTAFSHAAASFVETIKSSDPITSKYSMRSIVVGKMREIKVMPVALYFLPKYSHFSFVRLLLFLPVQQKLHSLSYGSCFGLEGGSTSKSRVSRTISPHCWRLAEYLG